MRQTKSYAACWDKALSLKNGTGARAAAVASSRKDDVLAAAKSCAASKFHGNLYQAYVLKSAYYYQLLPWYAAMPGRVHVLTLERLDADALKNLVENFLGLPFLGSREAYKTLGQVEGLVTAKRNAARDGGATSLGDEDRATLDDFYRPMNRKLDALLGFATGYPT